MGVLEYILLILVCIGGAFVQRVTGFGMGIFAMLFLPYFLPSHSVAVAVMGVIAAIGAVYNAIRHRKHIRLKTMLPLVLSAMAVIPLAVHLSASLPQSVIKRLLGVVLVVLSIYFLFFSKRVHLKPTVGNGIAAGIVAGMLNGMFNTGGPPAVLYLIHATADNASYFATIQAFFAVTNLFSTGTRAVNGMLTAQVLQLSAVAAVGWWSGNTLGAKIFDKLDADRLRKLIYMGMIVSGVLMILQG